MAARSVGVARARSATCSEAQGDLAAALTSYQASLDDLSSGWPKADPGNAGWQRDLSVSHDRIGDVQQAQGDLAAALTSYQASLAIRERLAKADPGNAGWQRDLALSYGRVAVVDDYVGEDNPVRIVDAFIDELDLAELGFAGVIPEATGRPSYHPVTLLKIYLYGYLNRVQSSRRLERKTQRNIEVMWLTGRLMPDFKTIADFRRDNGPAIRAVCSQFVTLCRRLNLFTQAVVAIDGSKFKAVNNRDKNFTVAKVGKRIEQVDASIARYLAALDRADRDDSDVAEVKSVRLKEKIVGLRRQMQSLKEMEQTVQDAPDQQVSLTDPDARSMATSGRGTGILGYNVQTAVDVEHHLIVAHEVTNVGQDRTQLVPMALKAQEATGNEEITVLADRGYFNGDQVLACENTGVLPCVPKTPTSSSAKRGLFTRQDFVYDAENDHYTCPAGEHLTRGLVRSDRRATSTSTAIWPLASPVRSSPSGRRTS